MVTRLHQLLRVRGRIACILHVRDVIAANAMISQAHQVLGAQVLVARAVQ